MASSITTPTPPTCPDSAIVPSRGFVSQDVVAADGLLLDMSLYKSGSFLLPSGGNVTWTWSAASTLALLLAGTVSKIAAAGTDGVQTAVADRWNAIPAAVFSHRFVKVVPGADVAGVKVELCSFA